MGNCLSKEKKRDKAINLDTVTPEAPEVEQRNGNITAGFETTNPSNTQPIVGNATISDICIPSNNNQLVVDSEIASSQQRSEDIATGFESANPPNAQPTLSNATALDTSTPPDNRRVVDTQAAPSDQQRIEAEATTTTPEPKKSSLTKQRLLDGGILLAQFTGKLAGAVGVLGPLKAACECVELTLQTVKNIKQNNDDSDALEKKLKFHLGTLRGHIANLEEDEDSDMEDSAATGLLKDYIKDLDEIYQELSQIQPNAQSMPRRLLDVTINKETIAEKIRKMDDALKKYTTSLQQLVADIVEQMQGNLTQFRKEFQEEAKKTEDNKLKTATVYGDQHKLCMPGTRKETLAAIHSWINDENAEHKIFYFLDIAGSGKSTVSKQLAQDLKGRFVARFFFSRDTEETMSTNSFCATVSDAFASINFAFKNQAARFKERPDFRNLSLEEQFEGLVADPLKAIDQPAILIVDALDECNNAGERRDRLLEMLHEQPLSIPLLRIFITARPEPDIKRRAEMTVGYSNFSKLEGRNTDVEEYIHASLKDFPEDQRLSVIRSADGLFIWARLACDMLRKSFTRNALLRKIQGSVILDDLYRIAMKEAMSTISADELSQQAALSILAMILAAQEPLSIESLEMLSPDLSQQSGVVEGVAAQLGSLLIYANRRDPIRLLHITFRDFLTDRSKAGPYYVQVKLGHYRLASQCIALIGNKDTQDRVKVYSMDLASLRKVIHWSKEITEP